MKRRVGGSSTESPLHGFGGHIEDDEIAGDGNHLDFGGYGYDPRLGRRWQPDPMSAKYPKVSPYIAFNANPILLIDPNGKEWVNAYDRLVAQTEKALIDNPNSRKLQRDLLKHQNNQTLVNNIIKDIETNDKALYDYVDKLSATNMKTGEQINIKVTVGLEVPTQGDGTINPSGGTEISRIRLSKDASKYIQYDSKEGQYPVVPVPLDREGKIGFTVNLRYFSNGMDNILANEIGDVMYQMEYPGAASESGSDANKTTRSGNLNRDEYMKKGSAGDYSQRVESAYRARKKSGEGKDASNNPYPLSN